MRTGRKLERLVRGIMVPEGLGSVTISFPMPWLFALIAETRMVFVSFRELYLLRFKIKNIGSFPFR